MARMLEKNELPATDEKSEVFAELRKPKKAWYANAAILLVTVSLFIGIGLLRNPIIGAVSLVGALFVHEAGHWLAMKLYKYSNVQMFFIPAFGAGVSGFASSQSATKKSAVDLAGCTIGIAIGMILSVIFRLTGDTIYKELANTTLILSLFNLIPLYPLDGGRFLFDIALSRNMVVEATYKAIAAIGLLVAAIGLKEWVFGLLAVYPLISIPAGISTARAANKLRLKYSKGYSGDLSSGPKRLVRSFVDDTYPEVTAINSRQTVSRIRDVWERIHSKPGKAGSTIGLIFYYLGLVLLGGISLILIA